MSSYPQPSTAANGLNANTLKSIAIAAMTLDHVLSVIWPGYHNGPLLLLLHCVGRLTMPIMCWFIAEGYHYTHSRARYAARLFAFALLSHFAYNFAFGIPFLPFTTGVFNQTSVLWSYAWAVVALCITDSGWPSWAVSLSVLAICVITFPSDWSCIAVMVILGFHSHRGDFKRQALSLILWVAMYAAIYCIFIDVAYGLIQMSVVLALPLLRQYNGLRGRRYTGLSGLLQKWFFYLYYPLHLVLVGLLRLWLHGNVGVIVGGV